VRQVLIDENSAGQRLDNHLFRLLKGVPKTHVYRLIRSGEVRVNKGRAAADTRLASGDVLRIPPVRVARSTDATSTAASSVAAREFPVLFEDEHLLVINKPVGVAVHGGSGVSFGVIEQLRRARPAQAFLELVHRLDKETSGVLVIAKKRSALTQLQDQFREHTTAKSYIALVHGAWPPSKTVIDEALHKYLDAASERRVRVVPADHPDGRRSITLVRIAQAFQGFTLINIALKTGRTHQIRVHTAHAGHPIVGDDKYGLFTENKAMARGDGPIKHRFERMFLHAHALRIAHPSSGEALEFCAPLPGDCQGLIQALQRAGV
jgi:23S rRNA pseudouridine955/2504/2580 synthase